MRIQATGLLFCLGLLLPCAGLRAAPADEPKEKVIIDQDSLGPCTSNCQSILMLIQSPRVDLLGITVISGDGWRDENVAHALRMLEILGRTDIPVVPGAVNPLVNSMEANKRWEALYGKLVYKGCWTEVWPNTGINTNRTVHAPDFIPPMPEGAPSTKPSPETAAAFLIKKVHEFPGQVTLFGGGPMTNIALAIQMDPQFASLVKELVIMGGSFEPAQNGTAFSLEYVNTPRLEFNFRWDPEAAHIVFHAPWKKLVQVPVDPTVATSLRKDMIDQIASVQTPLTQYLKKYAELGYPLWDELMVGVWLDPKMIAKSEDLFEDVDTSFTAGYGNTLSWDADHAPGLGEQKATVIQTVDVPRLEKLFIDLMRAPTPPAFNTAASRR
jgi:inosine-uridine nucleoside N-ribohydrolase